MHAGSLVIFLFKRTFKSLYCKHPSFNKLMTMKEDLKNYSKGVMIVSNFFLYLLWSEINVTETKLTITIIAFTLCLPTLSIIYDNNF